MTDRVTKEELASLVLNVKDVEVGGKVFGIKPLSYREELDIEKSVSSLSGDEKVLEKMARMVWIGLEDPDLELDEVKNLPTGLVGRLAAEIGKLGNYASKKE